MITNRGVLTGSTFSIMFFVGVGTAVIGAASKNIGLTPSQVGLMVAAQNIGFFLSLLTFGALADTVRKTLLLSIASLVVAAAFFLYYIRPGFGLNLMIMTAVGIGMGAYEGVADTVLFDLYPQRSSLFVTINHFFVTFGELMITIYLIFLQMRWRRSLVQAAALVFVLGIIFLFSSTNTGLKKTIKLSERFSRIKNRKGVGFLFVLALSAVGAELGMIGILTSFLMDLRGFTHISSKIGLAVFLGGIAAGRLIIGFLSNRGKLLRMAAVLFGLTASAAAGLFLLPLPNWGVYLFLFFTGVFIAGLFPLVISITGLRFREIAGTVLGIVKLGIPVGGVVISMLLSVMSGVLGLQIALTLFPITILAGFLMLLLGGKIVKKEES